MMDSFDKQWALIYDSGNQFNRYPYDDVVSFLFRNRNRDSAQKVLEVGCGAGNNLWFAAREGFQVSGFDASESVIDYAIQRFKSEDLNGDFKVARFLEIEYSKDFFDFIIDRSGLNCAPFPTIKDTIKNINKWLKPDGLFYMNAFSKKHSSFEGCLYNDDYKYCTNIKNGSLTDVGGVCFFDEDMIRHAFPTSSWNILTMSEYVETEIITNDVIAMWKVIAQKRSNG